MAARDLGQTRAWLAGWNADHRDLIERGRTALIRIQDGGRGAGAGTIWHAEGLILTNAHVARRRSLEVTLPSGESARAKVLARDSARDLAALTVEIGGLPTVELGRSARLRPGDWVVALGHPWGIEGAATAGVVIAVGPPPELKTSIPMIQTGLHLRPGHSGGPLLDSAGRLAGINTMMAGPEVGLAIPVEEAQRFLKRQLLN